MFREESQGPSMMDLAKLIERLVLIWLYVKTQMWVVY